MRNVMITVYMLISVCLVSLLTGCTSEPDSVKEVARQLKKRNISWTIMKPLDVSRIKYARFEEAYTLQGSGIDLDIFMITDQRTFENFGRIIVLFATSERKIGQKLPGRPDVYIHKPYAFAIREEPEPGQIKSALKEIFKD